MEVKGGDGGVMRFDPASALEAAAAHDPNLAAALVERDRARLLVEVEERRYAPIFTNDTGFRAGQTAQPSPLGTQFIATRALTSSAALQYTLPYGTTMSASLDLERSVRDSVILGNLGTVYGTGLTVALSQNWLRGYGAQVGLASLRDARLASDVAELERVARANDLASEVLAAYWLLWYAERELAIQNESYAVTEAELALSQMRQAAGSSSRADVVALSSELASAREATLSLRVALTQRRIELGRLIGRLDDAERLTTSGPVNPAPLPSRGELETSQARRSPQLLRLVQAQQRAEISASLARDEARPELQSVATFNVNGIGETLGASWAQVSRFEALVGYVGMRLTLPLVSEGLQAQADRAQLLVERAALDLEASRQQLRAQLMQRYAEAELARERIQLSGEASALAEESVSLQRARFQAGDGTPFEVTQAIQRVQAANLRVAAAQRDLELARVELNRLAGLLME